MAENEHELDALRDQWFLKQNRIDSVLMEEFRAGNKVVICKSCKKVWMAEIWDCENKCPARGCNCNETVPFTQDVLKIGPGKRIHIKQEEQNTGILTKARFEKIKALWMKYVPSIIVKLETVSAWCLKLACIAAVVVTVMQYRQGEIPDLTYFRFRLLYLSAKMGEKCQTALETTVFEIAASFSDAWAIILSNITDTLNTSFFLLKKTVEAAKDAGLKTIYYFYRN